MKRNFNEWLNSFRSSIATYNYYVDFEKVYCNIEDIKVELNILNSLIGSKNIEADFEKLLNDYPQILKCIPILLAVRSSEIYSIDDDGEYLFNFKKSKLFGRRIQNVYAKDRSIHIDFGACHQQSC